MRMHGLPRFLRLLILTVLAALPGAVTSCASEGVTMEYDSIERRTVVSSGELEMLDAGGDLFLEMSYGSPGKYVLEPDRIRLRLAWDGGTFLDQYDTLVLRAQGKRLSVPVALRSSATRMSESWELTATGAVPMETLRVLFPKGSKEGARGELLGFTFRMDARVAQALDEMLARPGAEMD